MPDSFFALQAQALTYTGEYDLNAWTTIAKATSTSYDVLITSLRVVILGDGFVSSFEVAVEPASATGNNVIFKAQLGNNGYYPAYQIFSKDSPCYLTAATGQGNGNQIRIKRVSGHSIQWWVSYVKLSENTGSQSWGNMT